MNMRRRKGHNHTSKIMKDMGTLLNNLFHGTISAFEWKMIIHNFTLNE